jgi:hypothetical protein
MHLENIKIVCRCVLIWRNLFEKIATMLCKSEYSFLLIYYFVINLNCVRHYVH